MKDYYARCIGGQYHGTWIAFPVPYFAVLVILPIQCSTITEDALTIPEVETKIYRYKRFEPAESHTGNTHLCWIFEGLTNDDVLGYLRVEKTTKELGDKLQP